MIPILYSPAYNVTAWGLERLHPFDGRKYRRIYEALIGRGLRRPGDFVRPRPARRAELLKVHSPVYLRSLRSSRALAAILEVPRLGALPAAPLDWRILNPMRHAVDGTILAGRMALDHGLAINLGGGFHHAGADRGGGFCVYADLPIAAAILREEGQVGRVLVVDLDAHQGNGVASILRGWPWASIFDLYQEDLFPFAKEEEDYPLPVPRGMTGPEYLGLIQWALPESIEASRPDLILYNAGSDPFVDDPLAGFRLTKADLAERDLFVVGQARERGIPLAMVLSGGYSAESWRIHAESIEGVLTRFDRVR